MPIAALIKHEGKTAKNMLASGHICNTGYKYCRGLEVTHKNKN